MNSGNQAVEAVLKLKKTNEIPGIFGTIAELGSADAQYATALEMAAGGKFTWIVVDHAFTAEKCIEYLKKNRIGRATFIPLSAVQVAKSDFDLPDDPKIYGKAVDLITFDPLVKKAFDFVFGRCVIVEDLRTANDLRLNVKRVTLDGDVVEATNIMTGGQKVKPNGVGFKSNEIAEVNNLEQEYASIQSQLESDESEIKTLQKKISDLYRKKISGDQEGQKFAEKLVVLQAKIEQINSQIRTDEQEIEHLLANIEQLQSSKTQIESEIQEIESQLTNIQQQDQARIGVKTTIERSPNQIKENE
jgi:chromosome segregation protein